ncbi:MAG: hypothetical protein JXQ71_10080 [Verrucomicrobia bacterium]|nr:hypothetical protein [Verrucomicrobiota bacterium]
MTKHATLADLPPALVDFLEAIETAVAQQSAAREAARARVERLAAAQATGSAQLA